MARKKRSKPILRHSVYGEVEVCGAGNGTAGWHLVVCCPDGNQRMLLAEQRYWTSPQDEVRNALWSAVMADAEDDLSELQLELRREEIFDRRPSADLCPPKHRRPQNGHGEFISTDEEQETHKALEEDASEVESVQAD